MWNELREKKCTSERRAELVGQLHDALTGKYREVALKVRLPTKKQTPANRVNRKPSRYAAHML